MNILVIDDEEILRRTLQTFLEDEGYSIDVAASGKEALDILGRKKMSVGIVDMNLPDMDGESIILKSVEIQPNLRFIIHTGDSNYTVPPRLQNLGFTQRNIMYKPILDLGSIITMINEIVAK